jgi:hypothetical protein
MGVAFWDSVLPADEWHGETFFNQDCTNVLPFGFQRSAISAVIAGWRPLCSERAGTGDKFEIKIAFSDDIAKSPRGFGS